MASNAYSDYLPLTFDAQWLKKTIKIILILFCVLIVSRILNVSVWQLPIGFEVISVSLYLSRNLESLCHFLLSLTWLTRFHGRVASALSLAVLVHMSIAKLSVGGKKFMHAHKRYRSIKFIYPPEVIFYTSFVKFTWDSCWTNLWNSYWSIQKKNCILFKHSIFYRSEDISTCSQPVDF